MCDGRHAQLPAQQAQQDILPDETEFDQGTPQLDTENDVTFQRLLKLILGDNPLVDQQLAKFYRHTIPPRCAVGRMLLYASGKLPGILYELPLCCIKKVS